MLTLEGKVKCKMKILFTNIQTDVFVFWINFHNKTRVHRNIPDEEYFCSTKPIRFEDCTVNKIVMRGTADQISNIY